MSSQYYATQNTYEALVDDDFCGTGAATENKVEQWIAATFESIVKVTSVTLSGFKGFTFFSLSKRSM